MRAGRRHATPSFDTKLDMTPLIDCIFQLILFLVLTSQITIQAEDVELPFALEGEEADKVEDKDEVPPLLVNVVRVPNRSGTPEGRRAGEIVYGGKRLGSDERQAEEALQKELEREVRYDAHKCDQYLTKLAKSSALGVCGMCLYVCPYGREREQKGE